jgi:SAM-dependent methyltransferase
MRKERPRDRPYSGQLENDAKDRALDFWQFVAEGLFSKPTTISERSMRLLTKEELIKTGGSDKAQWIYSWLLGPLQRKRFQLALGLLGDGHVGRLLEIGYGSGVFLPELARHCEELYAADIHPRGGGVSQVLTKGNLTVGIVCASMSALPFADQCMDCVVAISCLEYCPDQDALCLEIRRILVPGGSLILVTPGYSRFVDFGLRALTGTDAKEEYGLRRETLIATLQKYFAMNIQVNFPVWFGTFGHFYRALKVRTLSS